MAQIECGRGHLYDPDKYSSCPYCKNNQKIVVSAAGRTAPIGHFRHPALLWRELAPPPPISGTPVTVMQRTAPLSGASVTAPQKTAPLSGTPVTAAQKTMPPKGYGVPGTPAPPGILCRRRLRGRGGKDHGGLCSPRWDLTRWWAGWPAWKVPAGGRATPSGAASIPSAGETGWTLSSPAI